MKLTALVVAYALANTATAISNQAREAVDNSLQKDKDILWRYCSQEGQPCAHVTEAAEKASVHLTYPEIGPNITERSACYAIGGACQVAKRSAEALAFAVANAYASANPEPRRNRWCHLVGEPCLKARDFPAVYRREAEAEPEPEADPEARRNRWCHLVGEPCLKARDVPAVYRREAEAEPEPEADLEARRNRWCHLVGEPCLRKREPEATVQLVTRKNRWCHLVGEPCLKVRRSALPAPDPEPKRNRFCHLVGEPCLKLKRAADEIGSALYRRNADLEPRRNRWCHLVGEPCLKARSIDELPSDEDLYLDQLCNAEGAPCDVAKRAAEDLAFAATNAVEQAGL